MTAPNTRLDRMSEEGLRVYADEMLREARRAMVELERRAAQQQVAHLTPEQRRAQIRPVDSAS